MQGGNSYNCALKIAHYSLITTKSNITQMILIIMRHGEAQEYQEPDHLRALTEHGKKQCAELGLWLQSELANLNINTDAEGISLALVSPFLRTQQSFKALSSAIKVKEQITIDTITPMGNASQCADLIHGYASDAQAPSCLLVVTHMPLVSLLSDKVCLDFDTQFFATANALLVDYNAENTIGTQLAFYQGV